MAVHLKRAEPPGAERQGVERTVSEMLLDI
jgi:hypothetical protein